MTTVVGTRPLHIDLLCSHYRFDGFDCGQDTLNLNLRSRVGGMYHAYDPDAGLILVAHDDGAIRGYMWLSDMLIAVERDLPAQRCLYIAYLGVDRRYQGASVGAQLVDRAKTLVEGRLARGKEYYAEVTTTLYDHGGIIEDFLIRVGFVQADGHPFLWYRRIHR